MVRLPELDRVDSRGSCGNVALPTVSTFFRLSLHPLHYCVTFVPSANFLFHAYSRFPPLSALTTAKPARVVDVLTHCPPLFQPFYLLSSSPCISSQATLPNHERERDDDVTNVQRTRRSL